MELTSAFWYANAPNLVDPDMVRIVSGYVATSLPLGVMAGMVVGWLFRTLR